jgi:tetratricopeptide (TPR) repeat protein
MIATRLRALLALALFSAGAAAQSSLDKALALAKEKNYTAAQRMMAGVPEPGETAQRIAFHRLKAAIASGLGDAALAVGEMHSALALAPTDANLLLATAVSEMQAGHLDDALAHAKAAGETATAWAIAGDIEEKRGDYAAAASAYQAAVSLAPHQEPYRVALALELIQHQSFPSAIELLKQSAPLFPKSAKLPTLLGIANYASGFADDARASFEEAISVDPHFDSAYSCLARVVLESSAPPGKETISLLCRWNAVACSAVRLRVARDQDDTAAMRRAIAVLERAPAQNAIANCELARAHEWSRQFAAARQPMEACVRLDPTPQNHYRLGVLYRKLSLPNLARREMDLRNEIQAKMSEETAVGMNALQSFKFAVR